MPNCFSLSRKGSTEFVFFQTVDEEMCKHFQVECDPVKYMSGWYDIIGFRLACGKSFSDQRKIYQAEIDKPEHDADDKAYYSTLLMIVNWLEENFTSDAWVEVGRR